MDEEDFLPRPKAIFEPRVLDDMSIAELDDYIAELEGEIARVRNDIAAKQSHRQGVESLFRK
jgi:uncharacterized small protein (DUF1192 family)